MPLQFKRSLCTGCKLCQLACTANHEKVFNPGKARVKITHEYLEEGIHVASRICIFCGDCEEACPEKAISGNGSNMIVDRDKCVGCGTCVENCPTHVIYLDGEDKSMICDLCGGSPQCVAWCPKGAIRLYTKSKEAA
ncbi:MAG: 4Fe-4S dicluster domain-containing protein [Desulfobacterales bacterium]|nr:4Fe-4S dicluster domain-containing protein [Desulfobacterales bacterium]